MFKEILRLEHYRSSYLRSTTVLAIDVLTSFVASLSVVWMFALLNGRDLSDNRLTWTWLIGACVASLVSFVASRTYRVIIRYSTLREFAHICDAVIGKELLLAAAIAAFGMRSPSTGVFWIMIAIDFFFTLGAMVLVRVIMVVVYDALSRARAEMDKMQKVLVYGIGDKSVATVTRLRNSSHYDVKGFLVDSSEKVDNMLLGLPIYRFSRRRDIGAFKTSLGLQGVLFAYAADARAEQDRLIEYCRKDGLKTFITPDVDEIKDGRVLSRTIRDINIEDLLGRTEIKISMQEVRENFEGKVVLVTGAAGSIGSELCRQLAELGVKRLVMFDNAETPLHNIRLEFEDRWPELDFVPVIGDVRQASRLDFVFRRYRPQVVFHAAAYKHVPLMEENPCEAVLVNVHGSRNVADKCVEYAAEKMVMVSTDKAVNPTNIMGCTKRLAEIYVQSLGLALEGGKVKGSTRFVTTRFGNVLGSNGSVIPRFTEQIARGGPVTVTHPEIRRYFMTIPEACRLVMEAATMSLGNRIFVFDMGTMMKISELAEKMIHLAGFEVGKDIRIEYTGLRPGEKLYEEVLATKENTIPTDHDRIFTAKVREYDYDHARDAVERMTQLSREVAITDMVMLMKETVPEFKSKHSVFEQLDRALESRSAREAASPA